MLKGLIIYNKENGCHVYHNYSGNDFNLHPYELSSFIHAIRQLTTQSQILRDLKDIKLDRFIIEINDDGFKIKDEKGFHKKFHFHEDNNLGSVFSVNDDVSYELTNCLFKTISERIDYVRHDKDLAISDDLKQDIDRFLNAYFE